MTTAPDSTASDPVAPDLYAPDLGAPDLSTLSRLPTVLTPEDPGYAEACLGWNLAARIRPAAVAAPTTVEELAQVIRTATASGLRIAPQSTGHHATALADVDFGAVMLLRLSRLTGVTIDARARTARVLGGTLWQDVLHAAGPHGLTALHGSAGDVSVAGYLLGGGLSFYGRRHGLATNSVRAFELVSAAGELIRASAQENSELFWALRGGGGNFGVVAAIELDLVPLPDVVAGMMLWDIERAPDVLSAWAAWAADAPESATTSFRIFRFPPLPELPPFLSGRQLAIIDGAVLDDDEEAARILRPLRDLAPEMDTFARIPAAELTSVHMDPPQPTPAVSDHAMLAALPGDAIAALLRTVGPGADTPVFCAELRQLGGALRRPHDGALSRLDAQFALFAFCIAPSPDAERIGALATTAVIEAMRPWSTGRRYANFCDRPADAATMFGPDEWARLQRVRERCDPHGVWVAAHSVGPRPAAAS